MEKEQGLSIIVPVYNEEKAILKTLEHLKEITGTMDANHEIIVVNDGSNDNTTQILRDNKLGFQLIEHEINRGYGAAIKRGIQESRYDIVAITDADGTYPNAMIPELYGELKQHDYDMVVGARTGIKVKIPMIRRPAKWFLTKLANYLTEYKIPDLNSGLRLIKKKEVEQFMKILADGFSFTITITMALLTNNKRIKFVSINYSEREGKSKIKPVRDTLNFIQIIIRTVIYFNPLKIFVPVSLILFLASSIVFIYSAVFMSKILETTVIALLMTAIQILAIGMIADLIDKRNP